MSSVPHCRFIQCEDHRIHPARSPDARSLTQCRSSRAADRLVLLRDWSSSEKEKNMDFQLQLVLIPVADVDRAKAFYTDTAGFTLDTDYQAGESFRVVQCTPPGSPCSIGLGVGINEAQPGSAQGLHLVVEDIEQAHRIMKDRGVKMSDIRHLGKNGWQPGPHPDRADYGSFADFADPDGNAWLLQEVGHRADG